MGSWWEGYGSYPPLKSSKVQSTGLRVGPYYPLLSCSKYAPTLVYGVELVYKDSGLGAHTKSQWFRSVKGFGASKGEEHRLQKLRKKVGSRVDSKK